jgi:hypothetical protein
MNTIFSSLKFYSLCFAGFLCGAMMADLLNTFLHHGLGSYYQIHPGECWFTLVSNLAVVLLMLWRARYLLRAKKAGIAPTENVEVKHYIIASTISMTPLVRLSIYAGLYCIGLCLVFVL